ncbi:hypothetical protein, partial [Ruminococcus callidus]|uniref:hypothetical protein n=1 Tax=Ruminococcus callidus TaxID=40519 RepID=UPI0023F8F02D
CKQMACKVARRSLCGIAFSLCGVTVFYYTTKKAGWQSFFSEFSAKSKFYHFVKIKRKTM